MKIVCYSKTAAEAKQHKTGPPHIRKILREREREREVFQEEIF